MELELEVQRITENTDTPTDAELQHWVSTALTALVQNSNPQELLIRIVDETESAELNATYRHKAGPTNVLSFPFVAPPPIKSNLLGDLVICAPLVVRGAIEQNKIVTAHWAHLVIHGILHLLGHDHKTEAEAGVMENLERQILATLGYPDPYTETGEINS